jgi:hypothetical protein
VACDLPTSLSARTAFKHFALAYDFAVERDSDFPQTGIFCNQDIAVTQPIWRKRVNLPLGNHLFENQREIEPPSTHQKGNPTVQKTPTVRAVVLPPEDESFAKVRHYDPNRVIFPQYVAQQSAMIVVMMGQTKWLI